MEIWIGDFLDLNEEQLSFKSCNKPNCTVSLSSDAITVMLLDPSCSGSGLPFHQSIKDQERIDSLASFQRRILLHALTSFPSVKTVCYSTCSIYVDENECVVDEVLNNSKDIKGNYEVVKAVPSWKPRSEVELRDGYLAAVFSSNEDFNKNPGLYERKSRISQLFDQCFHSNPASDECRGFFLAKICRRC